jgi:hypothetical protein
MKYANYRVSRRSGNELCGWPELWGAHQTITGGFMNEEQNREGRLWDFIDGHSTAAEKKAIEELIDSNPEWQNNYQELLRVRQLMDSSDLDSPSLRFSKNVMEEIAKYQISRATKAYINKKIIWGIGGFFIVMILGILVYGFGKSTGPAKAHLIFLRNPILINWTGANSSPILTSIFS